MQTISIVVPVYQGELTLEPLLAEIEPLTTCPVNCKRRSIPRFRSHIGSRRRHRWLRRRHVVVGCEAALCHPSLAVAQLRPACSNARRHVEHERRLGRIARRRRSARPWRYRALARSGRGEGCPACLRPADQPATSRLGAEFLQPHGQVDLQELSWSRAYWRIQQFSAHPGRDRPRLGGLLRPWCLPRRGSLLGRGQGSPLPGCAAHREGVLRGTLTARSPTTSGLWY